MTTIACDGKMIAGDGLVTGNGLVHDRTCQKVFRLEDGRIVGFTGSAFDMSGAIEFLNGGRGEFKADEGFEAVILSADGKVQCMDGQGRRYAQSVPCVSGSGGGYRPWRHGRGQGCLRGGQDRCVDRHAQRRGVHFHGAGEGERR